MKVVFSEEKRAGRNVLLEVALVDCHPFIRPFRLRVNVDNPQNYKFAVEAMGYSHHSDGDRLTTSLQIYSGLHTQEVAEKLKELIPVMIGDILQKRGFLDGLSEAKKPKSTAKDKDKEKQNGNNE